jgi:hypothetical protein
VTAPDALPPDAAPADPVTGEVPATEVPAAEVPAAELPPQPVPEAVPEEEVELSEAELAAMGLSMEGGSSGAAAVDTTLKLSGFADIGMISPALGKNTPWTGVGPVPRHTSFYVGNLNVYLSKNLSESVRMFGEVRFMFLPNGTPTSDQASGQFVDTSANDYTDFGRPIQWGGINIQRLYLEWTAYRALQFRAGQYLTPYGIWNVDHGSPTIVPVQKPFTLGQQLFPERQTGIEVLGQADASAHHSFGYHLTLSNGTGPVAAYRDFDSNKAFGWRAWWRFDGLGELRVGTSGYYGRYTAANNAPGVASDGVHVRYTERITSSYDALALAGDVKWTLGGFLFQSEVITQQRHYSENGRVGAANQLVGQYLAPNDKLSWGVYGLIGYRFEWLGIMPYLLTQYIDSNDPITASVSKNSGFSAGLNIRPIDSLVLKLEYDEGHFPKGNLIASDPVRLMQVQIAWAF